MNKNMTIGMVVILLVGMYLGYAYEKNKLMAMLAQDMSSMQSQVDSLKKENDKLMRSSGMIGKAAVMKDGKMMIEDKGVMSEMIEDMTMRDGTKVMTTGEVVKKDGAKMMLKDGQSIWEDGSMTQSDKMQKTQ